MKSNSIKKNTEPLSVASKEGGLDLDTGKIRCIFMPSQQNAEKITTMTAKIFFKNVAVKMCVFCNSHI
jgi:hypothetical protein